MFKGKALFNCALTDSDPHDISLADMHDPLNIIDQMMELALKNGLKIRLHLTACDLNQNTDGQILSLFNIGNIRAFHDHKTVFNLIHFLGDQHLDTGGSAAAAFHVQVVLTDTLTLKGGTERHGNINFRYVDLQAANLNGLLNNLIMGNIGNNMLISTDTRGQYLGNIIIGNGRESPVDGSGGIGIPLVADRSECHDKGKGSILVVKQVPLVIAGLDTTKGKGDPAGKTNGKDDRGIGFSKGDQPRIPAHLNIVFHQQFSHVFSCRLIMHEDVQVLFLELYGNAGSHFLIFG